MSYYDLARSARQFIPLIDHFKGCIQRAKQSVYDIFLLSWIDFTLFKICIFC